MKFLSLSLLVFASFLPSCVNFFSAIAVAFAVKEKL